MSFLLSCWATVGTICDVPHETLVGHLSAPSTHRIPDGNNVPPRDFERHITLGVCVSEIYTYTFRNVSTVTAGMLYSWNANMYNFDTLIVIICHILQCAKVERSFSMSEVLFIPFGVLQINTTLNLKIRIDIHLQEIGLFNEQIMVKLANIHNHTQKPTCEVHPILLVEAPWLSSACRCHVHYQRV